MVKNCTSPLPIRSTAAFVFPTKEETKAATNSASFAVKVEFFARKANGNPSALPITAAYTVPCSKRASRIGTKLVLDNILIHFQCDYIYIKLLFPINISIIGSISYPLF